MLESTIQSNIIKKLTNNGWLIIKVIKCNLNGIPDLVCLKDGRTVFIEVKSEKGKPSELQKFRIKQLKELGFEAIVVKSVEEVLCL